MKNTIATLLAIIVTATQFGCAEPIDRSTVYGTWVDRIDHNWNTYTLNEDGSGVIESSIPFRPMVDLSWEIRGNEVIIETEDKKMVFDNVSNLEMTGPGNLEMFRLNSETRKTLRELQREDQERRQKLVEGVLRDM